MLTPIPVFISIICGVALLLMISAIPLEYPVEWEKIKAKIKYMLLSRKEKMLRKLEE